MIFKKNKRESFRVDDHIHLSAILRSDEEIAEIERNFKAYRMQACLNTHFSHQKETKVPTLKVIAGKDPELGTYLEFLESQIQQLAQLVSSTETSQKQVRRETVLVNLSADGMMFGWNEPIELGQHLELVLWLLPNELTVLALAEVIRIEEEEGETKVSVRFDTIHDEDREAIVRHVVRVQQKQLQTRRAG